MSAENAKTVNKFTYVKHKEYILDNLEVHQKFLGKLSVLVSDDNTFDITQIQEEVLNDHILNTLTPVTFPDGTQALIAQNLIKNDEETYFKLEDGSIFLQNTAELDNEKFVQLQLVDSPDGDSLEVLKDDSELSSKDQNIYTQFQIIDGVLYVVNKEVEQCQELLEVSNIELNNDEEISNVEIEIEEQRPKVKHICPREDCTKVFSTLNHLKVHERSHTGQRPYLCTHHKCKKSFSTRYSLKAHLRTHTGEKPYKCTSENCDKSFKNSGDLLKHVRTHTGERPFVCPYESCGRSFTTSNIRKVHVRTHTGERPFKCSHPKCGKAFATITNYKNHERTHSGEKPYVCRVISCGRRFTEYSSLHKHHIVHTQKRPFECAICNKQYRQHSTLIMHKKTVHSILSNDEQDNDDEVLDVLLENSVDMIDQPKKIDISKNIEMESADCEAENETQFILIQDPSQLVTFQTIESVNGGPEKSILDTALKELNIQYEDIELNQ